MPRYARTRGRVAAAVRYRRRPWCSSGVCRACGGPGIPLGTPYWRRAGFVGGYAETRRLEGHPGRTQNVRTVRHDRQDVAAIELEREQIALPAHHLHRVVAVKDGAVPTGRASTAPRIRPASASRNRRRLEFPACPHPPSPSGLVPPLPQCGRGAYNRLAVAPLPHRGRGCQAQRCG